MHPYRDLPDRQYWRSASARWQAGDFSDAYTPKFPISVNTRIGTGGSCFAQHIGRALQASGAAYMDAEPAPHMLATADHARFGYGIYSARYGNIYTARQLRQLLEAAFGERTLDEIWEHNVRYFDPLRPTIEPNGFASPEELETMRQYHLQAIRQLVSKLDLFVFTLGLTETWVHAGTGLAYPSCPGTVAGQFDAATHRFINLRYDEVLADMEWVIAAWKKHRPGITFLLTVSPVPLAATAEQRNVVVSGCYSKSVLRAVAGELCARHANVDYFPSYEMITSHLNHAPVYRANQRDVEPWAVERVMQCFLSAHGLVAAPDALSAAERARRQSDEDERKLKQQVDLVCDEAALDMS